MKTRKIFEDDKEKILKLFVERSTYREIAVLYGVSGTRIYQLINKMLSKPEIKKILNERKYSEEYLKKQNEKHILD